MNRTSPPATRQAPQSPPGFPAFMAKTLQPVETEDERRERWADEVWHSIEASDRVSLAIALKQYIGGEL